MTIRHEAILLVAKEYWGLFLDIVSPKRKLLRKFRDRWAVRGDKEGFMASRYFDLLHLTHSGEWVDDQTWRDLEFQEIFRRMDTTVTPVGSQILFAQLRTYVESPELLARRYSCYMCVADDGMLRESLQLRLSKLSDDANADLADTLFGACIEKSSNRGYVWTWSLLSLAFLVLVAFFKMTVWIWLVVVFVNVVLAFREASREHRESEAMKHAGALLNVADELANMRDLYPSLPQLAQLHHEGGQRSAVRRTLFWFRLSKTHPFSAVFAILNFVILIDLIINTSTFERFSRMRSKLTATYELVGEIDAAIAIASHLQQFQRHCSPTLVSTRTLAIADGYHPLLPDGVANSVCMERSSALITGSNMAGKTTFIKMLASNAILAQTVGFCLASVATIPRSMVMASIQNAHSVNSGKSHYFAEIETIDRFIRDGIQGGIRILAIDEPFNGTNTVERIAIARAVLESLGQQAIVLTTTHDVELQDFLGDSYVLYHFQENPDVNGYFDYQLKAGPARTHNAIKLLKRIGFPEKIVENAMFYANSVVSSTMFPEGTSKSFPASTT